MAFSMGNRAGGKENGAAAKRGSNGPLFVFPMGKGAGKQDGAENAADEGGQGASPFSFAFPMVKAKAKAADATVHDVPEKAPEPVKAAVQVERAQPAERVEPASHAVPERAAEPARAAGAERKAKTAGDSPFAFPVPRKKQSRKAEPARSAADSGCLRTGLGYDVHAFAEGRALVLGGVRVPCDRGLMGHSDADVLVHAIADALLGAAREGDIGKLFPDTDPKYAGADSLKLLAEVAALLRERGFEIVDVDSVVAAQAPKLSPYREEMRANIARAMSISIDNVGVKATTTEHLGFVGREEGISAMATCLLRRCS